MSIIDTPLKTTTKIACLKSEGVGTVIRYYNFRNSNVFPNKRLELPEAKALSENEIQLAVVFQQRQDRVTDFSETKGFDAGSTAFRHAQDKIGQPANSGIYFSVDFDASNSQITNNVIPYFRGVRRAFIEAGGGNQIYRIGVYGSGLVSSRLTDEGLIQLIWLAMSRGFRGTREALEAGEFHLAQRAPAARLCGLDVDFNDPNPARPDFGAFTVAAVVPSPVVPQG